MCDTRHHIASRRSVDGTCTPHAPSRTDRIAQTAPSLANNGRPLQRACVRPRPRLKSVPIHPIHPIPIHIHPNQVRSYAHAAARVIGRSPPSKLPAAAPPPLRCRRRRHGRGVQHHHQQRQRQRQERGQGPSGGHLGTSPLSLHLVASHRSTGPESNPTQSTTQPDTQSTGLWADRGGQGPGGARARR